ncbi:MAG TPA: ABC transporter permease [Steroidobacteraceae bacterium]|nr:ABC transporter permease [Steroidobacteraceae bacterium]
MPIIRALRHRKIGAVLIGLQIALTIAILANSLSVVQQRIAHMRRPTGLDEADIFTMANQFSGSMTDLSARIQADLARLRAIPGVVDAVAVHSFPLRGYGGSTGVTRTSDLKASSVNAAEYSFPERTLQTWGLRVIAGRNFTATEFKEQPVGTDWAPPPVVIVSQALAKALFPRGDALGKDIYLTSSAPTRIIGIVERAQTPWAANESVLFGAENAVLEPIQTVSPSIAYVVRTRPGRNAALLAVAQQQLYTLSRARIISEAQTFAETRAERYRSDRSLILILAVVCLLMMMVTVLGIVALTAYWVVQRRKYIGMRRALGARRADVLRYLQTENLLIAGFGAVLGVVMGLAGNAWLASAFEMTRFSAAYIIVAAIMLLLLSQIAVLWPALRAAMLPPVAAIRGH